MNRNAFVFATVGTALAALVAYQPAMSWPQLPERGTHAPAPAPAPDLPAAPVYHGIPEHEGKALIASMLKDSTSARFGKVWRGRYGALCGRVNGRNGFGAYAGESRFIVQRDGNAYLGELLVSDNDWTHYCD